MKSSTGEIQERISQALPHVLGLLFVVGLPRAARRSLNILRALQVYDSQPTSKHDGVTERTSPTQTASMFRLWFPIFVEVFVFITASYHWEGLWKCVEYTRRFLVMAGLSLFIWEAKCLALRGTPGLECAVGRNSKKILTTSWRANCFIADTYKMTLIKIVLLSLQLAILAMLTHPLVVLSLAGATGYVQIHYSNLNWYGFRQTSLRWHIFYTFIFVGIPSISVALIVVKACTGQSKAVFEDLFRVDALEDLAETQILYLIYPLMWGMFMYPSSFLVCLAYRFDMYCLDRNLVVPSEEVTVKVLEESRSIAEERHGNAPAEQVFDTSGHVQVDLAAASLNDQETRKATGDFPVLPTYWAALASFFLSVIISAVVHFALPSYFNAAAFPIAKHDIPLKSHFATVNFVGFISWPIIIIAMLTGAHWSGGTRTLWKYTEDSLRSPHSSHFSRTSTYDMEEKVVA